MAGAASAGGPNHAGRACYHPAFDRRRDHVKVDTIAVVGSGLMGRGIAYAAVAGGYRTVLHDVSPEALERARQRGVYEYARED